MTHLVCTSHKKRTMVLSDGTAVHRENSVSCDSGTVKIGDTRHSRNDVLYFSPNKSIRNAMSHLRRRDYSVEIDVQKSVNKMVDGLKKTRDAFIEFGEQAKDASQHLHDIFGKEAHDMGDRVAHAIHEDVVASTQFPSDPKFDTSAPYNQIKYAVLPDVPLPHWEQALLDIMEIVRPRCDKCRKDELLCTCENIDPPMTSSGLWDQ